VLYINQGKSTKTPVLQNGGFSYSTVRKYKFLAGPMQRINQYTAAKLVKLLIQTADEISKQLDCAGR